ncbi:type VI secretion system baseplate subunit TssG [Beijerinckia mobilis]|uniref:type VI secretion system baseplate subunit TssG n=1 Tax=Beijerinckia mobilis TaxID=231434 RepID=UPI00068B267E|nr:type VI secretion system baseplate subunit TssG [Beijerinckia mobilis]
MSYYDALSREPWRFDFLDMMRYIERSLGAPLQHESVFSASRPRIGDSSTRREEIVRIESSDFSAEVPISFGQEPWMAFPGSTIREIVHRSNNPRKINASEANTSDNTPPDKIHVVTAFLGLLGPQGALPFHLTEEARGFALDDDDSFIHFLDLFNNRFIQLFFRAWADARPIVQADRPEYDRFGTYILTCLGLGSPAFAPLLLPRAGVDQTHSIPAGIGLYAGLLGAQAKSASRLRQAVRGLLGVESEIMEFVGSWLVFDKEERSTLGQRFSRLGMDLLVGAASFSVQDKIRIRLYVADMAQYLRFLPPGSDCDRLVDLLFLYVGDELDWDVELALPARCAEPIRLGARKAGRAGAMLGWTSWLIGAAEEEQQGYRCDARFHPAERKRRERENKRDVELKQS